MNGYYRPRGFGGFSVFPPVIKNLLIINGVVWLLQLVMENVMFGDYPAWYILYKWFALNPLTGTDPAGFSYNFQVWQLVTYQFMHGGFGHILFNMFALWMFGMEIENMFGGKKFLIFYLTAGVVAGIFHLILSPMIAGTVAYTIGASGAVYGVLIAFALFFPNRYIFLWFLIPVKTKYLIGFLIITEFLFVDSAGSNVAHIAHLGGALAGFLFIMFDKNSNVELKNIFRRSSFGSGNTFGSSSPKFQNPFRKKSTDIEEATYYDLNNQSKDDKDSISQEEIDKILDKISQSGYQNLTSREKKILFEASKKMK